MSKRKGEVQSGREPFTGDGSATVQGMDQNRRATAAQMASRKIRQAKGHRRPAVPGVASPVLAGLGQQNAQSPFNPVNPNIVSGQNPQSPSPQSSFTFTQPTTGNPSAPPQQGLGSFSSVLNQTPKPTANSQNSSFNFARPQTFSFSTPASGFSFNAPSTTNPFSITNGPSNASTLSNGGFTGSIFSIPPSAPTTGITTQLPQTLTDNIFSKSSTINPQLPQASQPSKTPFSGLVNNNTIGTATGQSQQGNGVAPKSSAVNGHLDDADMTMMSASPDNSPMRQGAEFLSAGPISPTRDASKSQTKPSEVSKPTTTPFTQGNSTSQQTGSSKDPKTRATPSTTGSTSEQQTEASAKTMTAPSTTSSMSFGGNSQQKPMPIFQPGFTPLSATNSLTTNSLPANNVSQATGTSVTAPTTFTNPYVPSTATNERTSLTEPVGRSTGPPQRTSAPSTGIAAVFTDAQRQHYETLYQYLSLEASFKKQIANMPRGGDVDAITDDYWRRRANIFGNGSATAGSLAGTKRKEVEESTHERGEDSAKRSRVNGPENPIPRTLNSITAGPSAPVTTSNTGEKRKAEDVLTKDDTADTSKKARSQEPVSYPSLPSPSGSNIQPKAATPFTNILKKDQSETSTIFTNILKQAKDEKSSSSGAPGLKLPQFAPSTVNFLAQFSKSAQEAQEKEKAKRKAQEFDSEEEDEAEWERRDAAAQLAKKQKIEQQSKGMVAKYIPGKGFTFVAQEGQPTEGSKDDVPAANAPGPSEPEPPKSSGFTSTVFGATTSLSAPSNSERLKAISTTVGVFGSATGSNGTSVFGAAKTFTASSGATNGSTSRPLFGSITTSQPDVSRTHQTISQSFVSPFGTTTPSRSPPPSGGNSVFDQVPSFQQNMPQPKNIFAHLCDVDSGADNGSKAGDADDEGTETGEEDGGADGQHDENVGVADEGIVQKEEAGQNLDGDDASNENRVVDDKSPPKEKADDASSGESAPKPAPSGLSLFDRISRAEGDPRPTYS